MSAIEVIATNAFKAAVDLKDLNATLMKSYQNDIALMIKAALLVALAEEKRSSELREKALKDKIDLLVKQINELKEINSTATPSFASLLKDKLDEKSFLLGCLYRPHDENDQVLTQCITSITTAQQILPNINCSAMLLYGDLNFSHTSYESIEVNGGIATVAHVRGERQGDIRLQKCLDEFHFTQLITFPTYRCSRHVEPTSTLNLIITNEPDRVIFIKQGYSLGNTPMGQAHCFIKGQFAVACLNNSPTLTLKPRLIWSRVNYAAISAHIAAVEWETLFTGLNANDEYQLLANVYNKVTNLHIPSTTTPFTEKQEQWVTPELIEAVKAKRTSWAKYINTGQDTHKFLKILHRTACKKVEKMAKAGRQKYEELLVRDSESNPKRLHAYVRSKQSVSNNITLLETVNSNITTDTSDISASLNNYFQSVFVLKPEGSMPGFESRTEAVCVIDPASFCIDIVQKCLNNLDDKKSTGYDGLHPWVLSKFSATFAKPLSLIYKCSFATGVVPELWKKSNVTPIFKKGSRLKTSNFRPVWLTSIPCKIMDSILQIRITEHCVANGLISPNQHGFFHCKGCVSNLLETRDIMTEATHCRHAVDVIYTDFAKAFDKVPHKRLLHKLRAYCIQGALLDWIAAWLSNRCQRVVTNGITSEWRAVSSRVPQESGRVVLNGPSTERSI
ncbi:uncharacterized protein LOC136092103 [Hydra vulgaris]|uniref:Uncharacterized protein LOC136092103 n=1 Tax=Hydra vulgaris TaxID=6087 RepID=A0ABM4DMY0_HYDVU